MRKLVLALVLAATGTAIAQRSPDTATLDRGDGITRLGIDFGLSILDAPPYDGGLRVEPYGQYVTRSGLGFYGALPIAQSFGGVDAPPPDAANATAIGNLDVGLLYVIDRPTSAFVLRGGLALPFASDDRPGVLTNVLSTYPRLTDFALAVPDAYYLRFGVSPMIHRDKLFLRVDVGIDIGLDDGDLDAAPDLVRANIGGGVDLGAVALSLELVNLLTFDDFGDGEEAIHALTGTVRFMGKALQPVIALGAPLDTNGRERVTVFFAGGIQIVFR